MTEIVVVADAKRVRERIGFAAHLGVALGQLGYKSVIIDLKGSKHAAANCLGIPIPHDLHEVARGHCSLEAAFIPYGGLLDLVAVGDPIDGNDTEKMIRLASFVPMLQAREFVIVDMSVRHATDMVSAAGFASAVFAIVTPEQVATGEAHFYIQRLHRYAGDTCINIVIQGAVSTEATEVICGRLEHDCDKILGIYARCVACLPEPSPFSQTAGTRAALMDISQHPEFSCLLMRIAEGLCFSAVTPPVPDNLQRLIEVLFRTCPEDVAMPLWAPEAWESVSDPSGVSEKGAHDCVPL